MSLKLKEQDQMNYLDHQIIHTVAEENEDGTKKEERYAVILEQTKQRRRKKNQQIWKSARAGSHNWDLSQLN